MKSDNELVKLNRIKLACEDAALHAQAYLEYQNLHPISFDIKEKQRLFQQWYAALSDIISSVLESKNVFSSDNSLLNETVDFLMQPIKVPDSLSHYQFDEPPCLSRVLREARNFKAHPQKTGKEKFLFLADTISNDLLIQAFKKIIILVNSELNTLSTKELSTMLALTPEVQRQIAGVQDLLRKFLPVLAADSRTTPEQLKQIDNFLHFTPNKNNVIIVNNLNTEQ